MEHVLFCSSFNFVGPYCFFICDIKATQTVTSSVIASNANKTSTEIFASRAINKTISLCRAVRTIRGSFYLLNAYRNE